MHNGSVHGVSFLTLLASSSTLFCCALPALFVTLGAGSTLASLMSSYPALSGLSTHKNILFGASALLLLINGVWQYRQRFAPCPLDPQLAAACTKTRRLGRIFYIVSLLIYLTGFSFAFIVPRVMAAFA